MENEQQIKNGPDVTGQPTRLNYYNYFTEIEDAFIRRRRKHLIVGTLDWALMETWKEMGVPLHVVLRGIEQAFDSYESRPRKRSVKTLFYCQEEVEAQYAEWLESQLGASEAEADGDRNEQPDEAETDARLPFPRAAILEHLARARATLAEVCEERSKTEADQFCETLARVNMRLAELSADFERAARPDAEALEESLTGLEKILDDALRACVHADELERVRAAAEEQIEPYRQRMDQSVYEQTLNNLLLKRLREQYGLPRLSLFYL